MAETFKQVPLNGAYYGPPIPPQQVYHRPNRARECCCGPCCLLNTFLKFVITIIVVLGIITLVLWLIYRPHKMKVYASNATLNQFNLTNSNRLHYGLSLDIAIRNPNKKIGIYYDKLEASASYDRERFGYTQMPTFYQGHKNTTNLSLAFAGDNYVSLDSSDVADFNRETEQGIFSVYVKIHARIRFKVGSVKTRHYTPDFKCDLRVPLVANSSTAIEFFGTKCHVDF